MLAHLKILLYLVAEKTGPNMDILQYLLSHFVRHAKWSPVMNSRSPPPCFANKHIHRSFHLPTLAQLAQSPCLPWLNTLVHLFQTLQLETTFRKKVLQSAQPIVPENLARADLFAAGQPIWMIRYIFSTESLAYKKPFPLDELDDPNHCKTKLSSTILQGGDFLPG